MAVYCNYCELIYRRSYQNCPSCGGRLTQNDRPEEELLRMGYRYAEADRAERTDGQDDFYAQLNRQFERQKSGRAAEKPAVEKPAASEIAPEQPDFFARYDTPGAAEYQDPAAEYEDPPQITYEEPDIQEPPLRPAARERQHVRRTHAYRMPSVDWYLVFRILPYVCGGLFLVFLWSQRYAIAAAVMDVLIAFMPCILIILGIVWLFRSMFRH